MAEQSAWDGWGVWDDWTDDARLAAAAAGVERAAVLHTHVACAWVDPDRSESGMVMLAGGPSEGPPPMLLGGEHYRTMHGLGDGDALVVHTRWATPGDPTRRPADWDGPWTLWVHVESVASMQARAAADGVDLTTVGGDPSEGGESSVPGHGSIVVAWGGESSRQGRPESHALLHAVGWAEA